MAALTEQLKFLISANADSAIRAFEKTGNAAEKELGKAENKMDKVGTQLTRFGAGAMAFAGIAGSALYSFAKESENAEEQSRKLANSIENSGKFAYGAQGRMEELAKNIQKITTADGDAIVGMQSLLTQFGLTEEQIVRITPLVVDLSQKMGVDMDTAAKAVAKSATGSQTALKKMGIQVDYANTEGNKFDATMEALAGTVGGFAEKQAETFSGKIDQLKISLGDLKEGIGAGVIDVFSTAVEGASGLSTALGEVNPDIQEAAGQILAVGTGVIGVAGSVSFLAGSVIKMRDRFTDASGAINGFGKMAGGAAIALVGLYAIAKIFEAQSESGTAKTVEFTEALKENDKAARAENLRKLAEDNPLAGEFLETMGMVGITVDDMAQYLRDLDGPAETFRDAVSKVANTSFDSVSRIEALNDSLGLNIDTTKMTGEQADATWSHIQNLSFGLFNLEMANLDATTATDATASALTGIALEGDDAADAIDDVTGAAFELTEQWKETLGLFDRESALRNVKEDLVELKEAAAEAFSTGKQEDVDAYREKLGGVYKAVGDYIKELGNVPEEKQTEILALMDAGKVDEAYAILDALSAARTVALKVQPYIAGGFTSPSFVSDIVRAIPGRASGGPISANQPYVVGEEGPEIIVPGQSGTVIPNNQLGGAGSTVINVTVTSADPNEVVKALQRYTRTNGKLPKGIN
jgi:hypothetical protein